MSIPSSLMILISLALATIGVLLMFFPTQAQQVEALLNRIGGEQTAMDSNIHWDGWSDKHPRSAGLMFCLAALLCGWLATAI